MSRALNEQVVVITGASSGIGRETALLFGEEGASVVLAARNEAALVAVADEIERHGGRAHVVVTDVAQWDQVERLVREAVVRFGRIDTWVNNAAVSVYGRVEDQTIHDIERTIMVDLMGQIYGMKAVLPQLIEQGEGAIINVSSVEGRRAVPFHSAYAASKHGINGFSEALRMELERDHPGISVTVVMPASINTPFFEHSRSRMGVQPKPLPPVYEPHDVALAIVSAAVSPQRDVYVDSAAKTLSTLQAFSPAFVDRMMLTGDAGFRLQQDDEPVDQTGILDEPSMGIGSSTGEWSGYTHPSIYTRAFETLNPNVKRLMTLALGAGALALMRRSMQGGNGHVRHYDDDYADRYQQMPYPQAGYEEGWRYGSEPMVWDDPGYGPAIS
jgi:short-subunit dehydrogenase